jgi:ABC-type lipoprotein release transport system permease subunit
MADLFVSSFGIFSIMLVEVLNRIGKSAQRAIGANQKSIVGYFIPSVMIACDRGPSLGIAVLSCQRAHVSSRIPFLESSGLDPADVDLG